MGQTREQRLLKDLSGEKKVAIATNMFVPNHSGDLSAGKVLTTPTQDLNVVNKKYVDDAISAIPAPVETDPVYTTWFNAGSPTLTDLNITNELDVGNGKLVIESDGKINSNTGIINFKTNNLTTSGTLSNNADNSTHYFGAANDASIYFTGTDLKLKSNLVTSTDGISMTAGTGGYNFIVGSTTIMSGTTTTVNIVTTGGPVMTRTTAGASGQNAGIQIGLDGNSSAAGTGPSFLFFADDSAGAKEFLGRLGGAWVNGTNGSEEGKVLISVRANTGDTNATTQVAQFTKGGWDNLQDNYKLTFGVAKDASIYYDGADLIISPDDVGSGDVLIGATANKTIDAGAYKVGGTAGISATITTAALTALGAQGSMTFVNGILTAQTQST